MSENTMPLLKPLYANLLRIDFGEYLISNSFEHLCIELNIDKIWKDCERYISSRRMVVIAIPGYTGDADDALGLFLTTIFNEGKGTFLKFLKRMLIDFQEWSKKKKDLSAIKQSLLDLGYNEKELDMIVVTPIINPTPPVKKEKVGKEIMTGIPIDEKLCFVLMPFNENFNATYTEVIKKTVSECKPDCKRADEIFGTRPIMEDVLEHIKKARVLVADLTGRNANVFYELGFAHALDKKVILLTQEIGDVPFDLKHYRCIVYQNSIAGASKLAQGLKGTIEQTLADK